LETVPTDTPAWLATSRMLTIGAATTASRPWLERTKGSGQLITQVG
jgi:hypothetical protein